MQEILTSLQLTKSYKTVNWLQLPACFSVSRLAASSIGAVGSALSELVQDLGLIPNHPNVEVDQTLASFWFSQSISPTDWKMPPVWDNIAGDYRVKDGWIRLHTNLPHHKKAALDVLQTQADRENVSAAVLRWDGDELEQKIVAAGGVAALLRSKEQWKSHPQGRAIKSESLIDWSEFTQGGIRSWAAILNRPLKGLRVLDLTRVLAGPVATRTLAGFGAEVLRVDPPGWDESNIVPDITLGKRCTFLDLKQPADKHIFENLLAEADILVHGYRPDALDNLGFDRSRLNSIAPNIIEVCLDAYGWTGPWAKRRGFDSLVQMSCGIANEGMYLAKSDAPTPLPVQALDHATGYLMAAAAIRALSFAIKQQRILKVRLSLARTAELLMSYPQEMVLSESPKPQIHHYSPDLEVTPWGRAMRLKPALNIAGIPMFWDTAACELGSARAQWS